MMECSGPLSGSTGVCADRVLGGTGPKLPRQRKPLPRGGGGDSCQLASQRHEDKHGHHHRPRETCFAFQIVSRARVHALLHKERARSTVETKEPESCTVSGRDHSLFGHWLGSLFGLILELRWGVHFTAYATHTVWSLRPMRPPFAR